MIRKCVKSHVPGSHTDASVAEMHMKDGCCNSLIEKTAQALDEDTVLLMLLAVQKDNLRLSVMTALGW